MTTLVMPVVHGEMSGGFFSFSEATRETLLTAQSTSDQDGHVFGVLNFVQGNGRLCETNGREYPKVVAHELRLSESDVLTVDGANPATAAATYALRESMQLVLVCPRRVVLQTFFGVIRAVGLDSTLRWMKAGRLRFLTVTAPAK